MISLAKGAGQSHTPIARLTVAALAREAGVGRNAIYVNHRNILDDLTQARQRQRVPDRTAIVEDIQQLIRQLATENAGLMQRAIEAERRAERAERRSAQLTKELDAVRRPTMLRSSDG